MGYFHRETSVLSPQGRSLDWGAPRHLCFMNADPPQPRGLCCFPKAPVYFFLHMSGVSFLDVRLNRCDATGWTYLGMHLERYELVGFPIWLSSSTTSSRAPRVHLCVVFSCWDYPFSMYFETLGFLRPSVALHVSMLGFFVTLKWFLDDSWKPILSYIRAAPLL